MRHCGLGSAALMGVQRDGCKPTSRSCGAEPQPNGCAGPSKDIWPLAGEGSRAQLRHLQTWLCTASMAPWGLLPVPGLGAAEGSKLTALGQGRMLMVPLSSGHCP